MTTRPASGNRPDPCALSDMPPPDRFGRKSAPTAGFGASGAALWGGFGRPVPVRPESAERDRAISRRLRFVRFRQSARARAARLFRERQPAASPAGASKRSCSLGNKPLTTYGAPSGLQPISPKISASFFWYSACVGRFFSSSAQIAAAGSSLSSGSRIEDAVQRLPSPGPPRELSSSMSRRQRGVGSSPTSRKCFAPITVETPIFALGLRLFDISVGGVDL